MTEPQNLTYGQQQDVESHAPYMKIFWTLLVFTILEYFYAMFFQDWFAGLVIGLMTMALTKAALVGIYFMHLKFEGKWVYALLIPAGILAAVLMIGLYPDIAMQPGPPASGPDDDEAAVSAPAAPGRASALS